MASPFDSNVIIIPSGVLLVFQKKTSAKKKMESFDKSEPNKHTHS